MLVDLASKWYFGCCCTGIEEIAGAALLAGALEGGGAIAGGVAAGAGEAGLAGAAEAGIGAAEGGAGLAEAGAGEGVLSGVETQYGTSALEGGESSGARYNIRVSTRGGGGQRQQQQPQQTPAAGSSYSPTAARQMSYFPGRGYRGD